MSSAEKSLSAKAQAAAWLNASSGDRQRSWYRTVAGKLLIAFALIAALTVGATMLSLFRFNTFNAVLDRLIDFSLPAVKLSLGLETNATQVAVAAEQLGKAEDATDLFQRTERLTEQIQLLWAGLVSLRSTIGDTTATERLQNLVAAIDGKVGELNRITAERITLADRRERQVAESGRTADAMSPLLNALTARLALADSFAEAVYNIRIDSNVVATLLTQAAAVDKLDRLNALRERYAAARTRLTRDLGVVTASGRVPEAELAQLRPQIQTLLSLGDGNASVFALRERELSAARSVDTLRGALQTSGTELRDEVAALVRQAERESADSSAKSANAIASGRFWLILIAIASLVLAGFIVWHFVLRYVVARLTELARSMLAIAQGNLATPLPAAGPDELGDMSRALVVFRDNAREIRAAKEEAEKARAEAEAASRTKSAFLANMSHELRTPLNAIIGYSEMLLEDAGDRGDDASIGDLQKIEAAGKHLLGLINDILDLSKIEAGRMDVYLEQVYLARLVEDVKTIVAPMVSKNGNRLVVECPSDIGSLRTDLTKLRQSLINLLSNAAKFTKQGDVTLRLSRATGAGGLSQVKFEVADTGIGMTDEQMGRLFQAFTQADSSTTRNYGGTGLGLTITRHFCTMLGGSINVSSKQGVGSTFTIVLPDQAPVASALAPEKLRIATSGDDDTAITVLVVDDDPAVHEMLSATLAKEGYGVMHAQDGAEALELMRKTPPDIVTLDVMMPKVDGWSVLGIMKSEAELQHIPVIMLTIVDDRNLGYSLGASEFMTKPIDRARLVALLRQFAPKEERRVVLIVDDDPEVRSIVRQTVEGAGLQTAEAVNGRAALVWLEANEPPALILLDLMMPEVDGFEFLQRMRRDDEWINVPVVVLTAKELTESERTFLAERTILVLSKDAQPIGSLGAALSAIARRHGGQAQDARP